MKHILDDSRSSHFWSTFWSPIDACYIPFQSSGSQKSNALNSTQFGVETKKLHPLQANHSQLKEAFSKVLRNHLLRSDFATFLYSRVYFLLKLPDICRKLEAENLKVEANFAALRE